MLKVLRNKKQSLRVIFELAEYKSPILILLWLQKLIAQPTKSFSIYGEDVVIKGILDRYAFRSGKIINFSYIDIGGWRPISGSNTFLFYQAGKRGTIVEPNSHFEKSWKACRPGDKFMRVACSNSDTAYLNYFHAGAASNTLNEEFAEQIAKSQDFVVTKRIQVPTLTLNKIVEKHLEFFSGPFILDIDIEGLDFEVIEEFDFQELKRPLIILVEDGLNDGHRISESKITKHLIKHGYGLACRVVLTSIFIDLSSDLANQVDFV